MRALLGLYVAALLVFISSPAYCDERSISEYGIALLLDGECNKKFSEIHSVAKEKIAGVKHCKNTWHVTLYHAGYDKNDLPKLYDQLRSIKLSPLTLNYSQIKAAGERWLNINIDSNEQLVNLHKTVVEIAAPYHRSVLKRVRYGYPEMNNSQRNQADTYGTTGILEDYHPHTTLLYDYPNRPDFSKLAAEVAKQSSHQSFSCSASKLVIGKIGYAGNLTKVLYLIDIPKA